MTRCVHLWECIGPMVPQGAGWKYGTDHNLFCSIGQKPACDGKDTACPAYAVAFESV